MTEQPPLPPNTIYASVVPGVTEDVTNWIRPCTAPREWMNDVPQRYVYRCIPMVAANTMGWEVLNPVDTEVLWDGGELNTSLTTKTKNVSRFAASSHFGSGIVTWYLPFLFRTSADLGLMVTAPANHEHDNAVALDAFVRTDWLPFPFTMNWRLTRKNELIKFAAGEAVCRIYPYPIALLEETSLEIHNLTDDPGFLGEVNKWGAQRQANVAKQKADAAKWQATGEKPTGDGVWNSQYVRAKGKEGAEGFQPHQTIFKCAGPIDKRKQ